MNAIKVQSAASDDVAVFFHHVKVAYVLANFGERPGQERICLGKAFNEMMDVLGIRQNGPTRVHGPLRLKPKSAGAFWPGLSAPVPDACLRLHCGRRGRLGGSAKPKKFSPTSEGNG